jgi:hypothetical protein
MENILSIVGITCLSSYLLKAYFESTLVVYLASTLTKRKMYTFEDYENYVIFNLPKFLGSLLLCRVCLSFHMSYLVAGLFIACGANLSLSEFLTALGVSALLGASDKKIVNKDVDKKIEKASKVADRLKTVKKEEEDNSTPKDVGGMLIDYSGEKPKFLGYTEFYKDHVEIVFDEERKCDSEKCESYRKRYQKELADMKAGFSEKGEKCPQCNISSLKRKFYDIIKSEYK